MRSNWRKACALLSKRLRASGADIVSTCPQSRRMAGAGNMGKIQITAGDEFVEVSPRADSALSIRTPALIAAFPIDDILQWSTIEVGAEILTEHIDSAMAILIAVARDMRRDQHPRVG